jgi:hypothetical protein
LLIIMKRIYLFCLTFAFLILHCTNSLAQFKIDSVVFRLDGAVIGCSEFGSPCIFYSHNGNFHFIVSSIIRSKDSISYFGRGNFLSGDTLLSSAILGLTFDTTTGAVNSFYFEENYDDNKSFASNTLEIHNAVLKLLKGTAILTNYIDTPKCSIDIHRYQACDPPQIYNMDDVCWGELNFSDSISVTLFGFERVGVKENTDVQNLALYPNPSSNLLTIKNSKLETIEIFDLLGRNVLTRSLPEGITETDINISTLPEGCYFLRSGTSMQKFVVAR